MLRCVCHSAIDVESHGAVGIQTLANCLALSMLSSSGLLVAQAGQEHSTPVDRQTPPAEWELESSPDPLHKSAEVPGDELGFAQSAAAAHLSATLGSRPARSRQSHSALRSLEEHFDSDGHEPAERCGRSARSCGRQSHWQLYDVRLGGPHLVVVCSCADSIAHERRLGIAIGMR